MCGNVVPDPFVSLGKIITLVYSEASRVRESQKDLFQVNLMQN